ncbi:Sir2 family NAD-dependent protein deacetylase [Cupriavidus basilensis]
MPDISRCADGALGAVRPRRARKRREAYRRQPALVWEWYQHRRELVAVARPNPAHFALVALAAQKPVTLVTQNVDGLHQRAG